MSVGQGEERSIQAGFGGKQTGEFSERCRQKDSFALQCCVSVSRCLSLLCYFELIGRVWCLMEPLGKVQCQLKNGTLQMEGAIVIGGLCLNKRMRRSCLKRGTRRTYDRCGSNECLMAAGMDTDDLHIRWVGSNLVHLLCT